MRRCAAAGRDGADPPGDGFYCRQHIAPQRRGDQHVLVATGFHRDRPATLAGPDQGRVPVRVGGQPVVQGDVGAGRVGPLAPGRFRSGAHGGGGLGDVVAEAVFGQLVQDFLVRRVARVFGARPQDHGTFPVSRTVGTLRGSGLGGRAVRVNSVERRLDQRLQLKVKHNREDLETAYEELQSGNEELETMNEERRIRSTEMKEIRTFLEGMLASIAAGVVVLEGTLRVRSCNKGAEELCSPRLDEVHREQFFQLESGLPADQRPGRIGGAVPGLRRTVRPGHRARGQPGGPHPSTAR